MSVIKFHTARWESVADLARWLLTHADEFDTAIVTAREPDGMVSTFVCPTIKTSEALGILEVGKMHLFMNAYNSIEEDDDES